LSALTTDCTLTFECEEAGVDAAARGAQGPETLTLSIPTALVLTRHRDVVAAAAAAAATGCSWQYGALLSGVLPDEKADALLYHKLCALGPALHAAAELGNASHVSGGEAGGDDAADAMEVDEPPTPAAVPPAARGSHSSVALGRRLRRMCRGATAAASLCWMPALHILMPRQLLARCMAGAARHGAAAASAAAAADAEYAALALHMLAYAHATDPTRSKATDVLSAAAIAAGGAAGSSSAVTLLELRGWGVEHGAALERCMSLAEEERTRRGRLVPQLAAEAALHRLMDGRGPTPELYGPHDPPAMALLLASLLMMDHVTHG
jgi:hypothetical protein